MSKRTLLAVRHEDGHLELLEPVDIPVGAEVTVTLDLPEPSPSPVAETSLPTRHLGPMRTGLGRDDIYHDLA